MTAPSPVMYISIGETEPITPSMLSTKRDELVYPIQAWEPRDGRGGDGRTRILLPGVRQVRDQPPPTRIRLDFRRQRAGVHDKTIEFHHPGYRVVASSFRRENSGSKCCTFKSSRTCFALLLSVLLETPVSSLS